MTRTALVVCLSVATCSFGTSEVAFDDGPPREATSEFLSHLRDGDNESAYEALTDESRSLTTFAEFEDARDDAERKGRAISDFEFPGRVAAVAGRPVDEALAVPVRLHYVDGSSTDTGVEST